MAGWHRNDLRVSYAIVVLIGCLFFADLFVRGAAEWGPDNAFASIWLGVTFGQFIGQLNLISVWAAVSRGQLILRLPWALLLTVLMWAALLCGCWLANRSPSLHEATDYGVVLTLGSIAAQVPLWLASWVFGWQLIAFNHDLTPDDGDSNQFNIGQMLIGTLLLAVALALAKSILPQGDPYQIGSALSLLRDKTTWVLIGATAVCNLLLVVPCIWAAFMMDFTVKRLAAIVCVVLIVSLVEVAGLSLLLGPPGKEFLNVFLVFAFLNLGQMAVVYGSLRFLRTFARFRLVRISSPVRGIGVPADVIR